MELDSNELLKTNHISRIIENLQLEQIQTDPDQLNMANSIILISYEGRELASHEVQCRRTPLQKIGSPLAQAKY